MTYTLRFSFAGRFVFLSNLFIICCSFTVSLFVSLFLSFCFCLSFSIFLLLSLFFYLSFFVPFIMFLSFELSRAVFLLLPLLLPLLLLQSSLLPPQHYPSHKQPNIFSQPPNPATSPSLQIKLSLQTLNLPQKPNTTTKGHIALNNPLIFQRSSYLRLYGAAVWRTTSVRGQNTRFKRRTIKRRTLIGPAPFAFAVRFALVAGCYFSFFSIQMLNGVMGRNLMLESHVV